MAEGSITIGYAVDSSDDEIWLHDTLISSSSDTCDYEIEDEELMNMVLGIEIIDFRKDD